MLLFLRSYTKLLPNLFQLKISGFCIDMRKRYVYHFAVFPQCKFWLTSPSILNSVTSRKRDEQRIWAGPQELRC
jgi:hypothetical protein